MTFCQKDLRKLEITLSYTILQIFIDVLAEMKLTAQLLQVPNQKTAEFCIQLKTEDTLLEKSQEFNPSQTISSSTFKIFKTLTR